MALHDTHGKAYAHASKIKEGDRVKADGGFPCIPEGTVLTVRRDPAHSDDGLDGLYVDCTCEETDTPQKHFLDGQSGEDGALTGLYPQS